MSEPDFAVLLSALAVAFFVAAVVGKRGGDTPRDVRLLLASGAAFGGIALVLLSLWKAA